MPFTIELKSSSVGTSLQNDGSVPDNNRTICVEVTTAISSKSKMYFFWGINAKPFLDTLLINNTSWASSDYSDTDHVPVWVSDLHEFYGNLTNHTIER